MSKVTFNDHLDDMMERLMDENLKPEELDLEIKRGNALCQIATKKIEDKKTELKFVQLISNGEIDKAFIPASFAPTYKMIGDENKR